MKKFCTLTLTLVCLIIATFTVEAASSTNRQIAVVIVGNADYKTKDFIEYTNNFFKASNGLDIVTGKAVQTKYQNYWLDKGLIDEGTPTKEDFINFVNYSGYNKVVYLVIKDSVIDQHGSKKGKGRSRASLTINAFLVDKMQVLKVDSSTNEEDSKTSELRARRGAFKQCVKEISENLNPLLK